MRTIAALLLAMLLAVSPGCVKTDWIDRTLVTENVTGTWEEPAGGAAGALSLKLELEQQGSTVKGFVQYRGQTTSFGGGTGGPIAGTIAGDVFRFRSTRGDVEGELTISGDEMNGLVAMPFTKRPFSFRRVDRSSPPALPPR